MIDLTPILNYIVEIAVAVLTPAILYFGKRLADKIGMDLGDGAAVTVEHYVEMGAEAVAGRFDSKQNLTDNKMVEDIVLWVVDHAPKAMKASGLDASDLRDMVKRRLAD